MAGLRRFREVSTSNNGRASAPWTGRKTGSAGILAGEFPEPHRGTPARMPALPVPAQGKAGRVPQNW